MTTCLSPADHALNDYMQIMVPYTYTEFIDDLTTQVQNKVIPMSRIDDAVYRILRVKFSMGLFENPYPDPSLAGELGKQVSSENLMLLL
jgi:beta-glucosidase